MNKKNQAILLFLNDICNIQEQQLFFLMLKNLYLNKTILITGGSSGLGSRMAINYAKQGGRIINLARNTERMQALNKKLNVLNGRENLYFSIDIANYDDVKETKNHLVKNNIFPDVVINNAAGNFLCPFENLSNNGWKRVVDIVLNGTFNVTHIFGKEMIRSKQPGVFLNISTTYAENGSALVIPSGAAKAGVDSMMKGLTVEWAPYGIRFVGIAPGPIEGSGGVSKLDPLGLFKFYTSYNNPSGRFCKPDEIAELSMFLTSDKADYINGEIVRIDGGELIKNSGEFSFLTNIPFYKSLFKR
jgi:2,4-dienoyl-CoA reductase